MRNTLALAGAILSTCLLAACNGGGNSTAMPVPAATPTPQVSRAAGQFYAQYTGPKRPALDVIMAAGRYSASQHVFTLIARLNGPVTVGAPNYYVWGFNGGSATNAPFPGEPNVKFDTVAVVVVNADGTTTTTVNGTAQPSGNTTIAGDTIVVSFADSLLPSNAAGYAAYTWNLWPRIGVGGLPSDQIAAFAPENAMAPLTPLP